MEFMPVVVLQVIGVEEGSKLRRYVDGLGIQRLVDPVRMGGARVTIRLRVVGLCLLLPLLPLLLSRLPRRVVILPGGVCVGREVRRPTARPRRVRT